ncbi:MAG: hypothetical protein ACI8P0_003604 [Planctomycetaceae bacterium]|jgi:hypothetical protein
MRTCVIAACCVDEVSVSESAVRGLFKSVCSECPGAETQESGLPLTALVFCDPLSARLPTKASSG